MLKRIIAVMAIVLGSTFLTLPEAEAHSNRTTSHAHAKRKATTRTSRSGSRAAARPRAGASPKIHWVNGLPAAQQAWAERTQQCATGDPRTVGRCMMHKLFPDDQWPCLERLGTEESGWRVDADNPNSSAYGVGQALPGSKMITHGLDWLTNLHVQISWMLDYVRSKYGSPCRALRVKHSQGFY